MRQCPAPPRHCSGSQAEPDGLAERFYHRAFKDVLAGADFFTAEVWDGYRYVLHDRETKFCASLRSVLAADGVKTMALPAGSQNLDACAERRVRSARSSACEGLQSPRLDWVSARDIAFFSKKMWYIRYECLCSLTCRS